MKNNILFLLEEDFRTIKKTTSGIEEILSLRSELSRLANNYLFSIETYKKLVRKKLGLKNKIPIYFSKKLLLFTLKDKKGKFLINYFNIFKICYLENIKIIFTNGEILQLHISKSKIEKEIKKINKLKEYLLKVDL